MSDDRRATIYDVAKAAGVSHQTVSRYLAGFAGIRPETRRRVEDALQRLGYRPNLTARSLKSGRSHIIGALTHDLAEVGPGRTAEGATAAAREAGYLLDLITLDVHNPRAIRESLRLLTQHPLAGVLALSSTDEMLRVFEGADFGLPFHIHSEPDETLGHATDLGGVGIAALVGHLASLGHRRVAHISGPPNWPASRNRARALQSAVAGHGIQVIAELVGDWSARSAYASLHATDPLPDATAFVASNDQMALGVMLALKERGLRIPDDVSVVGIDDIPEAAFFDPPLTTVRIDFAGRGRQTIATLLSKIEPHRRFDFAAVHPPQLVVRRSTAPPAR